MPTSSIRTALVTGANGYIGNAVARAFVRAGWVTYGLVRSASGAASLAAEEILPVIGSIDDVASHDKIQSQLPPALDAIVSTTEDLDNYARHYGNIITLLRTLAAATTAHSGVKGKKPIVIFTSGCKDYGPGPHYADDPDLAPHTEESPLRPPALVESRARLSRRVLDHADAFDPVLVRPTNVHGRSSSYYRLFFVAARRAVARGGALTMVGARPASVCHSMHVDDCGDAYVAIAAHPRRGEVAGQVFNVSGRRYETVDEVARALAAEFGIGGGVRYVREAGDLAPGAGENPWPPFLLDFPQWTGSEKLRRVTGWSDHRPLFSEAIHVYRVACEAAEARGHEDVKRIESRVEGWSSAVAGKS